MPRRTMGLIVLVFALAAPVMPAQATGSPGALDSTFGTAGKTEVAASPSGADFGAGVALTGDGHILIAGDADRYGAGDLAVVRLTGAGRLDTAWASGGVFRLDLGAQESASAVAVDSQGRVVIAGSTTQNGGAGIVVRLLSSGAPDTTFGSGGAATISTGRFRHGRAIAVGPGDAVVVAGDAVVGSYTRPAVAVLTAGGVLESGFAGGVVVSTRRGTLNSVAVDGAGTISAVGTQYSAASPDLLLARYTSSGSPSADFGSSGMRTLDLGGDDRGLSLVLRSTGALYVGASSYSYSSSVDSSLILSFSNRGRLKTTFANGTGKVQWPGPGVVIGVEPSGAIVGFGGDGQGARLLRDGSFDPSFGSGGKTSVPLGGGSSTSIDGLAVKPDGNIVVAGWSLASGNNQFLAARFLG